MPWPPDADLLAAWQRLCDDPTAFAAFTDLALVPLAESLAVKFPLADDADLFDAATDALLAFRKRPEKFDPAKSPLPRFLLLIARRRMINLLEAGRRHREGRIPWDSVELGVSAGNEEVDDDPRSFDTPELRAAIDKLSDVDRRVFEQMILDSRDTPAFVAILGLAGLSADDERHEVKKAKDRVTARLKRARGGSDA